MYIINKSSFPWTCFPDHLDTSNFIDVSVIGREWAIFWCEETGREHDCSDYYDEYNDETVRMEADYKPALAK